MPRLIVVDGPWHGCAIGLESGEHTLGRDRDCDLAVPDTTLSRRHLRFVSIGDAWDAEDLGSRNGTLLNDQPLTRARPCFRGRGVICVSPRKKGFSMMCGNGRTYPGQRFSPLKAKMKMRSRSRMVSSEA